ncbi:aromatic ring-hydroxylating oxygenase subunit alpha [Nocardia nova]|uniref:aromatic ring-hydroxylating oxygenase subunit alpha n=1 Tax=Nocardia nova TaxID=37330 RepID=UPI0007A44058|nr:aromatic ring-hydroxylating dioxygenase subunit alpha [Nocardia nova]
MNSAKPGDWVDTAASAREFGNDRFGTRISTDRYTAPAFAEKERDAIWSRVWQIAGRVDDLPETGDWKEYRILDQSFVLARGRDGTIRGFVNACRHRGNPLCSGSGNAKRGFLCQYHLWSYDLEGRLKGILRQDAYGDDIEKSEHSLFTVPVECFAGFIFLNPDPHAAPLMDFIGPDVAELLAPYHLDRMTTVMDVREGLNCNWKVVMDAFSEGYHIAGIHPELLRAIDVDGTKARYRFFDDHSVAVAPFEVANAEHFTPEQQVEGIRGLTETFPGVARVLPAFDELVAGFRDSGRDLAFPAGVTARTLLQQATRAILTEQGLDVSGLTDAQMSDNHGWFLFPNFFMTIRAGECHVIMSSPHPDGDPHRCIWHVCSYMYLPEDFRDAVRAAPVEVDDPGSYKYFLALEQDYEQMPRQQRGLRSNRLEYLSLVGEEIVIAHFHSVLDRYLAVGRRNVEGAGK